MGGGSGLSKIGAALTVIFVVSLVVLLAELYYFLWRRRVFRKKTNTVSEVSGGDNLIRCSSGKALSSSLASSKELLYFFCLRSNYRLDRSSITPTDSTSDHDSKQQSDIELIDIDMLKTQSVFGPPRFLFTIKEEEEEDLDSPSEQKEVRVSLEEVEDPAAVVVEIDDRTPFSTPCASPMYFTPSASPAHEVVNSWSTD
ncbi:uncharacterized protein [Primulina eburnea]|uniref:uncharacterized protein n=1 Tax=Primulina eburnea TaxID=1245227 RepID=UPI003C6C9C8D